jgi:hypothetical protein
MEVTGRVVCSVEIIDTSFLVHKFSVHRFSGYQVGCALIANESFAFLKFGFWNLVFVFPKLFYIHLRN